MLANITLTKAKCDRVILCCYLYIKKEEPQITANRMSTDKSNVFAFSFQASELWICDKCIADIYNYLDLKSSSYICSYVKLNKFIKLKEIE